MQYRRGVFDARVAWIELTRSRCPACPTLHPCYSTQSAGSFFFGHGGAGIRAAQMMAGATTGVRPGPGTARPTHLRRVGERKRRHGKRGIKKRIDWSPASHAPDQDDPSAATSPGDGCSELGGSSDWERLVVDDGEHRGRPYYVNILTGESRWTIPASLGSRDHDSFDVFGGGSGEVGAEKAYHNPMHRLPSDLERRAPDLESPWHTEGRITVRVRTSARSNSEGC